ncbi:MAG: hypothetical protein CV045_02810 [Cyanobacteria bacterium M5B4]|nr:MAG: hypothetical protein CV045_02810 [Cyanobacteria bacterium M5B4]
MKFLWFIGSLPKEARFQPLGKGAISKVSRIVTVGKGGIVPTGNVIKESINPENNQIAQKQYSDQVSMVRKGLKALAANPVDRVLLRQATDLFPKADIILHNNQMALQQEEVTPLTKADISAKRKKQLAEATGNRLERIRKRFMELGIPNADKLSPEEVRYNLGNLGIKGKKIKAIDFISNPLDL